MTQDAKSSRLSLLVLKTPRVDVLLDFYRRLGLTFTQEQHGSGPVHYSCQAGGVVLEIYPFLATSAKPTTRLGFDVPDMTTCLESLAGIGSKVLNEPKQSEWGLRAVVRDPDGRAVEIVQR